jgi:hypothetical protein
MRSPILVLHIIAGTLGMLSGFVAVFLRKGSRQHGLAGPRTRNMSGMQQNGATPWSAIRPRLPRSGSANLMN